ncbi:MAG TPA: histidine kinase [Dinghuibacter sp.]|jgi:LytS/YehU family sensor histidine kinase|uniref:sensor histidine kinase n=1 Tax=Dinghuibacter sp. TaxID=2024697 RepID=UPI002C18084E|nr:histidine kinase [Dinghuibacter sp.]HTJ14760.1 histidine kinase [Dinghuibacter sp.]
MPRQRTFFHGLFWLMYVVFMIMDMQGYIVKRGPLFALLPLGISLLLMLILVYGNTLLLIPYLLERKRPVVYGVAVLLLVVGYTLARSKSQQYWDAVVWPDEVMTTSSYFKWNLFYAVWFILISSLLLYTQRWAEQRQQVKNIQIDQLQTELKYLRAQVNPHFLFNGLNTIYGTIDLENKQARDMVVQFSDLLRYNLYEADVDVIGLGKEIEYLENYVALQRARSDANLHIELRAEIQNPDLQIAPLIFVGFVENAFKYSTRDDEQTNSIYIGLRQTGPELSFECRNSFEPHASEHEGIGLGNVRRRLELLYPGRHYLTIRKENGMFTVNLTLRI